MRKYNSHRTQTTYLTFFFPFQDNTVLDRYDVPQGSIVLISLYAMQRSTSIWGNDAHNCNPDRFRNPTPPMLGAYAPFSSGSRTCIGNHFAINEGRIVLAALLSHFDIELAPTSQFQVRQLATLRPTPELLLNFRVKM
jgi:cytochrome P450